MSGTRIVAPGKLMLAGEYSVLGPSGEALAIAVEPGVEATYTESSTWRLVRSETGESWEDGGAVTESFKFAHAAIAAAQKAFGPVQPLTITTRSLQRDTGGGKWGLGTSASATVAVAAAVQHAATKSVEHSTLLPVALAAHTEAQNGRGSGYDVATIVYGGLVRWRPARLAGEAAAPYEISKIDMPKGLHLLAAYSGKSASTTQFIQRIEEHAKRNPAQLVREYSNLSRPVGGLIDALQAGNVTEALDAAAACQSALSLWDQTHEFGIVTPEISQLIAAAEALGGVAKVSGAGGGDSVLGLFDNQQALELVSRAWSQAGYAIMPISIVTSGVIES